jgi:hypothetical protein
MGLSGDEPRLEENAGRIADLVIRAADAKEVGVGNPAEETCCHPNHRPLNQTFPANARMM